MRAVLSSGSNMGDARAHLQTVADEFARRLVGARLHGLPELVLEALRDQRHVQLVLRQRAMRHQRQRRENLEIRHFLPSLASC